MLPQLKCDFTGPTLCSGPGGVDESEQRQTTAPAVHAGDQGNHSPSAFGRQEIPVSDLCDEYQIQPTLFYLWQRQAMEHLSAAFADGRAAIGPSLTSNADRARVAQLEARLAKKDEVIAEISEEHLALKKEPGGS